MENQNRDSGSNGNGNGNVKQMKVVWMIVERGDRSFWTRIGVAFTNRDGSLALSLDAFPAPGSKMQIRDYTPRDADTPEGPDEPGVASPPRDGQRDPARETSRDGAREAAREGARRTQRVSEASP